MQLINLKIKHRIALLTFVAIVSFVISIIINNQTGKNTGQPHECAFFTHNE
jgi:methyl-accepting chemotaxis protein|tara:strand:- start:1 stop:153 length:153 start_codon:yes stop_codon:yes gene_type:complete